MTYNAAEREVIGLCIGLEAVDDLVNYALLTVTEIASRPGQAEVCFQTRQHQQLFLARLLDFANESSDESLTGVRGSCLDVLRAACRTRSFDDEDGSVELLGRYTNALQEWLLTRTKIKLWLPTLKVDAHLEVPRVDFLYISGNLVKHNLSRLTGVSKRVKKTLDDHGYEVPLEQIPLALDDFRGHLEENYFVYYGTWMAEMINDIRWGLQLYLTPVYRWSYTRDPNHDIKYSFKYPDAIGSDVPRDWFWRLMNNIRSKPCIKRFAAPDYMKSDALEW